jgi:hypothetical protein
MKLITRTLLVLVTVSMFGCKMVYFDKPQPVDGKHLTSIPKKYRGTWKYKLNTLTINKFSLVQSGFEIIKIPLSTLDTSTAYVKSEKTIYKFEGDHLEYKGEYSLDRDTLFIQKPTENVEHGLNNNIILKKIGNYYILNIVEDNGMWQVIQIEKLNNNDILLKLLDNDKLLEIVERDKLIELTPPSHINNAKKSRDYYYAGNLLQSDIKVLIEAGAFSDTLINLPENIQWVSPMLSGK